MKTKLNKGKQMKITRKKLRELIQEEVVNFEGDDARAIGLTFLGLSILSIAMMVLLGMVSLIIAIFKNRNPILVSFI